MAMLRLFLAVEVNDTSIYEKIAQIQQNLKATNTKMSIVRPENIHFTLKFLGDSSETLVDPISDIMQQIDLPPFQITISQLGCFPRLSYPRVIWLGVSQGYEQLNQIASFLDKHLHSLGFKREKRKFSAHLTLARVKSRADPNLIQLINDSHDIEIGSIIADEVVLKKSTLTPQGAIYESLRSKKLS